MRHGGNDSKRLVVFGRRRCLACQQLKEQLLQNQQQFDYFCLDPPDCEFSATDPHAIKEWDRARIAMTEATTYRLIKDDQQLPVLLRVWADPCENTDAFIQIDVLQPDGTISLRNLGLVNHFVQEDLI